MTSTVSHLTLDSADPYALASFWADVLGGRISDEDRPGDEEVLVLVDGGQPLLFVRVPEAKAAKNRLHLDLRPEDRTRDEEVRRLVDLGAAVLADHRGPEGAGWVTLADPEGNELCVLRSAAEGPSLV
jgi:predicted enzyme related to lactoylglutathione lyase